MSPRPLQLGTLKLRFDPNIGPSSSRNDDEWLPLDVTFLDIGRWAESDRGAAELLKQLLGDGLLCMTCQRQRRKEYLLVRVSIVPNDDGRGLTKKTAAALGRLFALMHRSWDGEKGRLLGALPEDIGTDMQSLYALIQSPPEPHFEASDSLGDNEIFDALAAYENPPGVRTMMYRYQIRSVARMLQMESQPGTMVDPSYSAFTESGTDEKYYVNLQTMNVIRQPHRYALTRGGILCEQMGVGKTLMCLALVLASRHQPTKPPPDEPNVSEVFTDVALREYSTQSAFAMRDGVGLSDTNLIGTPSLTSMCADLVSLYHPGVQYAWPWALTPSSANLLNSRKCVYYRFPEPTRRPRTAKRVPEVFPQRFILAQTTLVVVPPLLVPQWLAEAETHLVEGALRILVVPDGKGELPPVEELIRHDIVLMSVDRFRKEYSAEDEEMDTELLKARWKRIILGRRLLQPALTPDEGNIANNDRSEAMLLVLKMQIERRWIVSGTPTTRLKQGTESATQAFLQSEGLQRADSSRGGTPTPVSRPQRSWSKADFDDVTRLGKMLKTFLDASIFKDQDFQRSVTNRLRKRGGPEYGAVDRIRQIMSAVMVKHRPGVIDQEVEIPQSSLSAETVHLTHWQRLTYNALTALIVSNVYTSNFEDQDYFLHPRNVDAFKQVVFNLHLACLWLSSPTMDLAGAITRNNNFVERRNPNEKARAALEEANEQMQLALDTPGWAAWMHHGNVSVPYETDMLPLSVNDAWSEAVHDVWPYAVRDGETDDEREAREATAKANAAAWPEAAGPQISVIDAHNLQLVRDMNSRGASLSEILQVGWEERTFHRATLESLKVMEAAEQAWLRGRKAADSADIVHHRQDKAAAADRTKPPKLSQTPRKKKAQDDSVIDALLDEAAQNAERMAEASRGPRPLPAVIHTSTRSAKINYVVRAVLAAPPTDKFVMFGNYDEIAHVHEGLALAGIISVFSVAREPREKRKQAIRDFAKPAIRVILLELKFAARGLTLTLANRMIFLSPVWSLDVQAQAIKRIHRIGQTRPTHIEILVTDGTFEEDIVRREAAQRSNEEEKNYSRALIENPRFVRGEHVDEPRFPLRFVPPGSEFTEQEEEEYARYLRAVRPPAVTPVGSAATTPIVTPGTPLEANHAASVSLKRHVEFDDTHMPPSKAAPIRQKKRARFAD